MAKTTIITVIVLAVLLLGCTSPQTNQNTNPEVVSSPQINVEPKTPSGSNEPPILRIMPPLTIEKDSDKAILKAYDLWGYAVDEEDTDELLTFSIEQTNLQLVACRISENRYIDCGKPSQGETDTTRLAITVRDTGGLTARQSVQVTVR